MTIRAYLGTPGSGKSYSAICEILQYHRRPVFANFPLTSPRKNWVFVPNERLTPGQLVHETHGELGWARGPVTKAACPVCGEKMRRVERESRALVVIDECGLMFNADQSIHRTAERKEWLSFFAQHRKLGYDVIMVTQLDRQVDVQIRGCWEETVTHFKLNDRYWFLLFWFPLPIFLRVSHWYHMRRFGGRLSLRVYLPWRGKRYDSMRLFDRDYSTEAEGPARAAAAASPVPHAPSDLAPSSHYDHVATRDQVVELAQLGQHSMPVGPFELVTANGVAEEQNLPVVQFREPELAESMGRLSYARLVKLHRSSPDSNDLTASR